MHEQNERIPYASDLSYEQWEIIKPHIPTPQTNRGRKRHIVVDTIGLLLVVIVHSANIQDRDGAKLVLKQVKGKFSRLELIWADAGYSGQLVDWVKAVCSWMSVIVKRSDDIKGFQVLPRRWVVERTFGWLGRYRRLSKDYEGLT